MIQFIEKPKKIEATGNIPKIIEEFIGRVNSNTDSISIAKMSSPIDDGAEYIAVCLPAFSPDTVNRDEYFSILILYTYDCSRNVLPLKF